jgi:hypothetical protein
MEQHECDGRREGGWIIYSCPKCDYEMRKNPESGELIVENMKPSIRHYGTLSGGEPESSRRWH